MKYKLENLAGKHRVLLDKNKYCLSGDSKYIKKNILKLFSKSNILGLVAHEIEIIEHIELAFDANLDQMTKFKKLLKKLK